MSLQKVSIVTLMLMISLSCKKEKEDPIKACETNKTGTIKINLSGNLGLEPVDVYVNNIWVDSLMVYDLPNNMEDYVEVVEPAGSYSIRLNELQRNGGDSIHQWDTILNVCDNLELSYYKKR